MATPDNTPPELHAAAMAPQTPVAPTEIDSSALDNSREPNIQQMQMAAKAEQPDDQQSQPREQKPYTDGASYIANSLQAMRDAYKKKGAKAPTPAPTGSQAAESEAAETETAQTQADPFDPDSFDNARLNAMQSSVGEAQQAAAEAAAQQVVEGAMSGARMTLGM